MKNRYWPALDDTLDLVELFSDAIENNVRAALNWCWVEQPPDASLSVNDGGISVVVGGPDVPDSTKGEIYTVRFDLLTLVAEFKEMGSADEFRAAAETMRKASALLDQMADKSDS